MNPRLYALSLSVLLSACVVFLQGPLGTGGYVPRGLPLTATETIVIFVSTEMTPVETVMGGGYPSPLASPASVADGIMKGFRAVRQDAKIELADESLRKTCFERGTKSVLGPGRPVLVVPALDAPDCRALLEARGIRYLVLISGSKWTSSSVETVQMSFLGTWSETFHVVARLIDAKSGAVACEEGHSVNATSHGGVIWLYIPVPYFQFVDNTGHWERAAWYAGNKVGGCFVQPWEKE